MPVARKKFCRPCPIGHLAITAMALVDAAYKIRADAESIFKQAKILDQSGNHEAAEKKYRLALYRYGDCRRIPEVSETFRNQIDMIIDAVFKRINQLRKSHGREEVELDSLLKRPSSSISIVPPPSARRAEVVKCAPAEPVQTQPEKSEKERLLELELQKMREEKQQIEQEKHEIEQQRQEIELLKSEVELEKQEIEKQRRDLMNQQTPRQPETPLISDHLVQFSDYSIVKHLGKGTFGQVSLARNKKTDEYVALKILQTELETYTDQLSFLREVESLARVKHPALLNFKGFTLRCSDCRPSPAIFTEYLPNGSLEDVLEGKRQLTMTETIIALYGTAEGMRYMHEELSMVHRDLKLANVMLNKNKEPVIGDFGLSKIMTLPCMRASAKIGTPVYMAPELFDGGEYTNKVDVYAYAVMVYELMTKHYAFGTESSATIQKKVCMGIRPPLPNEMHLGYKDLITRAWAQDPDQRPTFREICQLFQEGRLITSDADPEAFAEYVKKMK